MHIPEDVALPLIVSYPPHFELPSHRSFNARDRERDVQLRFTLPAFCELVPLAQGLTANERALQEAGGTTVRISSRRADLKRQMGANNGVHTVRRGYSLGFIVCRRLSPDEWPTKELEPHEQAEVSYASNGLTLAQTAKIHGYTPGTSAAWRTSAMAKLGARNMAQAVTICYALGFFKDMGRYAG